jgi:hypothetical protein
MPRGRSFFQSRALSQQSCSQTRQGIGYLSLESALATRREGRDCQAKVEGKKLSHDLCDVTIIGYLWRTPFSVGKIDLLLFVLATIGEAAKVCPLNQ